MTLSELLLALSIAGVLAMLAVPPARRTLDALHVRAAREAVFGAAVRTRSVALAQGGADLVIDVQQRTASVAAATGLLAATVSVAEYDVAITSDAFSSPITIHYDGRGIGRVASHTLRFQRGDAEAGLTFSSYGRVHRW